MRGRRRLPHADRPGEADDQHHGPLKLAAISARSSGVTAGRTPNQRSNPGTAWCSSMPSPSTVRLPRAMRRGEQLRLRAGYRRCPPRRRRPAAPQDRSQAAGLPVMPRLVALTRSPQPASARVPIIPVDRMHARAEVVRQGVGPAREFGWSERISSAPFEQVAMQDRPRRAAGAEHHHGPRARLSTPGASVFEIRR